MPESNSNRDCDIHLTRTEPQVWSDSQQAIAWAKRAGQSSERSSAVDAVLSRVERGQNSVIEYTLSEAMFQCHGLRTSRQPYSTYVDEIGLVAEVFNEQ